MLRNKNVLIAVAVGFALGEPAHAQTQAAAGATSADALAEVVVTAQRREQKLQDVPISILVLSTDSLQKFAADNIADAALFVPGLVVSAGSPTQPHYQVRGIGASDFGVGTEPAVGVYVDGVYAARSGASFLAFNDIERVEVLKGPQGTLLGRSSAAGAISIITRKPVDVEEGSLDVRLGNEGKRRFEIMANEPAGDGKALRFNVVTNDSDGYLTDAATGQKLNPERNWAARAAFRWDIDTATQLMVAWNHDAVNQLARPPIGLVRVPPVGALPTVPPDPTGASFLNPITAPIYNDVVGNSESRVLDEFVVNVDRRFGGVDFHSTTDWRQFRTLNREDEDGTNRIATYFDTANVEHNAAWYQEFRLSSKGSVADWVAGVSYSSEHAQQASVTDTYTDSVDTVLNNVGIQPGGLFGPTSAGLAQLGIPINLLGLPWTETMYDDGKFKSLGVFGDVIWHVTDAFNVTTGLRYSHDSKDFTWLAPARQSPALDAALNQLNQMGVFQAIGVPESSYIFNFVFPEGPLQGVPYSTSGSWSDLSPRIVLDYKFNPTTMVYASAAKGFTPGGFDSVSINGRYSEETVWNYELGIKASIPQARLVVDASVYQYQYKNKQSLVLSGVSNSFVPEYNVSSSDQKARGADLELHWQPVSSLSIGLAAAYVDSTYQRFVSLTTGANLAGQPTGEPFWSGAATIDYTIPLAEHGAIDVFFGQSYRGAVRCNGESQANRICLPAAPFPLGVAQHPADARIGWKSANGHLGIGGLRGQLVQSALPDDD
jgi:iron complex outermembrane receptor protein